MATDLSGLPALEALRRQAGGQNPFAVGCGPLGGLPPLKRPSQPPTPQSSSSGGGGDPSAAWSFEEQFKQVSFENFIFKNTFNSAIMYFMIIIVCFFSIFSSTRSTTIRSGRSSSTIYSPSCRREVRIRIRIQANTLRKLINLGIFTVKKSSATLGRFLLTKSREIFYFYLTHVRGLFKSHPRGQL